MNKNMEIKTKPFSIEYVLTATKRHMLKSIEISIKKTVERISEFSGDREKSEEVFKTLSTLDAMKREIEATL
jgi:transposase